MTMSNKLKRYKRKAAKANIAREAVERERDALISDLVWLTNSIEPAVEWLNSARMKTPSRRVNSIKDYRAWKYDN